MFRRSSSRLAPTNFPLLFIFILFHADYGEAEQAQPSFSIMAFNVENLFDTVHDEGKLDYQYLPLSLKQHPDHARFCRQEVAKPYQHYCLTADWSEEALAAKMAALARAILQYDQGRGPDILVLPEVENLAVVTQLNEKFLQAAQYQTVVLLEGPDKRGIDVAILSRFPLSRPSRLHQPRLANSNKTQEQEETRAVLEVNLLMNGTHITVFGLHLPSQAHPKKARAQVIRYLNQLGTQAANEADIVLAAGDFNINGQETHELYRKHLGAYWYVSHLEGCKQCAGTYYYRPEDTWSFLDAILLLRQTADSYIPNKPNWRMDPQSVVLAQASDEQTYPDGHPRRFASKKGKYSGVSDHFPIAIQVMAIPAPKISKKKL